jgi:hypothetical protein
MMIPLAPRDRAEFYADLYDVPIEEIERRYGLVLLPEREPRIEHEALT